MKVAFDTSVLVPALVAPHRDHARALWWLRAAERGELQGVVSWHALGETWSVLTRLPIRPRVSPSGATRAVERLASVLAARELDQEVYRRAWARCTERGAVSGALFDALHYVCAELDGADLLLTFNREHFARLARDAGPRPLVPPDPPGYPSDP